MHYASVSQAFLFGLLVTAPLAAGYTQEGASEELTKRHVGGLAAFAAKVARNVIPDIEARHHTEAQIAAKKAKAAKAKTHSRDVPAPDEFGPWDSTEDEFGSWVDRRDVEEREPHHTEAQIAAKKAKAAKAKGHTRDVPAPDEFGPWDSTEDEFGSWVDKRDVEEREPHHTEAQIAAKKAKAGKAKTNTRDEVESREPHHTEAQIAAKKAKAAKAKTHTRDEVESREPHHTEAQIAAKKAKAAKAKGHTRDVPAPDEFGPWDSTEDEFGSWVDKRDVEEREPHHTEAQISAKKAKAAKAKAHTRDELESREPHHTEAQIAAKKAKAAKEKAAGH